MTADQSTTTAVPAAQVGARKDTADLADAVYEASMRLLARGLADVDEERLRALAGDLLEVAAMAARELRARGVASDLPPVPATCTDTATMVTGDILGCTKDAGHTDHHQDPSGATWGTLAAEPLGWVNLRPRRALERGCGGAHVLTRENAARELAILDQGTSDAYQGWRTYALVPADATAQAREAIDRRPVGGEPISWAEAVARSNAALYDIEARRAALVDREASEARYCCCGAPVDPSVCGARGMACVGPAHSPGCTLPPGHDPSSGHSWQGADHA